MCRRSTLLLVSALALMSLLACDAPALESPTEEVAPQATQPAETTAGSPTSRPIARGEGSGPGPIIIDHTTTDLTRIPSEWLAAARRDVVWLYGHTSHGSQLVIGAGYLSEHVNPPAFNLAVEWGAVPGQRELSSLRLADDDDWSWDPDAFLEKARGYLDDSKVGPRVTAFMWSWCGEMSDAGTPVQRYLEMMTQLEEEYPRVRFVYMTGHTDGGSAELAANNDLVRRYVREHGKVLYDFADIESCMTPMASATPRRTTVVPGVRPGVGATATSAWACRRPTTSASIRTGSTASSRGRRSGGYRLDWRDGTVCLSSCGRG